MLHSQPELKISEEKGLREGLGVGWGEKGREKREGNLKVFLHHFILSYIWCISY